MLAGDRQGRGIARARREVGHRHVQHIEYPVEDQPPRQILAERDQVLLAINLRRRSAGADDGTHVVVAAGAGAVADALGGGAGDGAGEGAALEDAVAA